MPTRILEEFIGDNMHKAYPLVDTVSQSELPASFLADLKLCISDTDRPGSSSFRYSIYVSEVRVYSDYIYIVLSDTILGEIAKSDPIPTNIDVGSSIGDKTIMIRPVGDIPVNGSIIIGTCKDMRDAVGILSLTSDQGMIFPANVIIAPTCVSGIRVGDTVLTGEVEIVPGDDRITIEAEGNKIKININYPDIQYTKEDLVEKITEIYGTPVTNINGIPPAADGTIRIMPTDCLMVEIDEVSSTISFYNPCGSTCASEEFMSDTYNRIDDLNRSAALLSSFYSSASNTLAQMGARVSSVLEPKTKQTDN